MHTKNTLNAETMYFVTKRNPAGESTTVHGSLEFARRAKDTFVATQGYDPDEIHIYKGVKQ